MHDGKRGKERGEPCSDLCCILFWDALIDEGFGLLQHGGPFALCSSYRFAKREFWQEMHRGQHAAEARRHCLSRFLLKLLTPGIVARYEEADDAQQPRP
ncbi:MAG: hypothetical protein WDA16_13595, partial [Candidatus Thermoplasmatota archaeon]